MLTKLSNILFFTVALIGIKVATDNVGNVEELLNKESNNYDKKRI